MIFFRTYPIVVLAMFSIVACVNSSKSTPSTLLASSSAPPSNSPLPAPPTVVIIPTPEPIPVPSSSAGPSSSLDTEEIAFVTLINNYRVQNNASKLQVSIALTQSSHWLSVDMASKNYFDHTDSLGRDPFTRIEAFNYNANAMAENIAAGNSDAQSTFNQWKNSPGHNANMLNPAYLVIGVGRANNSQSSYNWYWTTDFGSSVDATLQY